MRTLEPFILAQAPTKAEPLERDVNALRRARDFNVALLEPMRPLERDLESKIITPDPDGEPLTAEERDRSRQAAEDLAVLREGAWGRGYNDGRLTEFVGGPGIKDLLRAITICNEMIGHEEKMRRITWPAPHRYTGGAQLARINGRVVRRGEIVHLTRTQSELWSDRFALVTEDAEEVEATS